MKSRLSLVSAALASLGLLALALPAAAQKNADRNVYFGQTHSHTSWSLDAYIIGNTVTGPAEAYEFSMGKAIKHPAGFEVKLRRPLDFHAVTDHSEYAGMVRLANDPTSELSKQPIAQKLKVNNAADVNRVFQWLAGSLAKAEPIAELLDPKVAGTVWKENIAIADRYYKPGKFTTFVAYEWTSAPNSRNMHRNVFFKDSKKVPVLPFTAIESQYPNDLWNWMDGQRQQGNELLAISHNANLSDGIMFPVDEDYKGRPIDAAWAHQRMTNEPLTEMVQIKGTSETHPTLSPNDEFANHELMSFLLGRENSTSRVNGSYIRQAYQHGLAMQNARGYNPYKMGVVGASDSHNTVIAYTASSFFGQHGSMDGTAKVRMEANIDSGMATLQTGGSGLAGVWAEENTREAIFAALQRKETFATTGVRIKVRLFGGWDFRPDVLKQKDWAAVGYALGVPMGGDLPAPKSKAPSFIVWAVKDADEANLDRVQIIKGWTKNGQIFERVYDVAWSGRRKPDAKTGKVPTVGSTVDIKNASYRNTIGAVELKAVWTDPEFDPSHDAFYYARVLQIPTPRWSTVDARTQGIAPLPGVPAQVQERAWSSPIWFTPTATARQGAAPGTTVSQLKERGGVALDDAQLKQLVVGKTLKIRNTVTGERFEVVYGADGRRMIASRDGRDSAIGDLLAVSELGVSARSAEYQIQGGRIVTMIGGTPFDLSVYKVGDKYLAARSNEFAYANYEVEPMK